MSARDLWVAVLLGAGSLNAGAQERQPAVPEVVTSGHGSVQLPADFAVVRFNVVTRWPSASEAAAANGPVVAAVSAALRRAGFAENDVRTTRFAVGPNVDHSAGRRIVDYQASASLELRVRDIARLPEALDAGLGAGATGVDHVNFVSDSVPAARKRAMAQALAAAREDAETLARESGGRLGALQFMTTTPPAMDYSGRGLTYNSVEYLTVPVVDSKVSVSVSVQARWAVLPAN